MKRILPGAFLFALLLAPDVSYAQWNLVWSDEFDGDGEIDQSKWNFETFEPGATSTCLTTPGSWLESVVGPEGVAKANRLGG